MSVFDLKIHSKGGYESELLPLWKECYKKYTTIDSQEDTLPYASWQHMTTGYNAGYYSYLYSEIIAKDLFSVFQEKGVLDEQVGREFRKKILEPVCIEDGNDMVRSFLGRDFNQKAFLKSLKIEN